MKYCLLTVCALAAVACSHSRSENSAPVLAAATIGPEGGEVAVTSGPQAGLRLTIPAGALAAPTEIRVRDAALLPAPGIYALSYAPVPGQPFTLEPVELRLDVLATLRAPYRVIHVLGTAPGNVLLRQARNGNLVDLEPVAVDLDAGWIEVPLRTLSQCNVVRGPSQSSVAAYWQAPGTAVALADGYSFAVEEVPAGSPFAAPDAYRWRITAPGVDDLIYFRGTAVVGRESDLANWREAWAQRYPVWEHSQVGTVPGSFSTTMAVSSPMNGLSVAGAMTADGQWGWSAPRTIGGTTLRDVVQVTLALAWNRHDLGVGQRQYVFWFAPGVGLLGLSEDAIVHARTTLTP
ncbi:MAG: hypothetical protein JNK15_10325 [Planctomycetes bacterium]|nr:hypothetical protein [Planctomycetota bacterium]